MTDLTLLETEDALRRLDLRDAMDAQARIERIANPLRMSRIPILRDGCVDGVGLAAIRYRSHFACAPRPLWERAIVGIASYFLLRKRNPLPVGK